MTILYNSFNWNSYQVHRVAYDLVPPSTTVLDVGCSSGYFGRELIKKSCVVVGIEKNEEAARYASKIYKEVFVSDLENPKGTKIKGRTFDVILLLDVIEHIINRKDLLAAIKNWLKPGGLFIVSTPNIAHISIRF